MDAFDWNDHYCSNCESEFHDLTDKLIMGIQHLETKVVYLRYLLSMHLPDWDGKMLRCDIFHDLTGGYWDHPAYQSYISKYYDGRDPMESKAFTDLMWNISRGKERVGL
jgi:hypothetical protein